MKLSVAHTSSKIVVNGIIHARTHTHTHTHTQINCFIIEASVFIYTGYI